MTAAAHDQPSSIKRAVGDVEDAEVGRVWLTARMKTGAFASSHRKESRRSAAMMRVSFDPPPRLVRTLPDSSTRQPSIEPVTS
jgi:hypothetical protein